jgi:SAM-dependent methyltransferase
MGLRTQLKRLGYRLGLLAHPDLFWRRREFSLLYIRGRGLEIGALHDPLPVRDGVVVEYVDVCGRQESIAKFPELDADKIVNPTHICDGFLLSSIPNSSQDFVIANHVLEHSPDPLRALTNWTRVLRPNGVLFTSLPIAEKCFDKGRVLTTLEHLVEDFELTTKGDYAALSERNRHHYEEFLTISNAAVARGRGEDRTSTRRTADRLRSQQARLGERLACQVAIPMWFQPDRGGKGEMGWRQTEAWR